jgi:hypothetical protein
VLSRRNQIFGTLVSKAQKPKGNFLKPLLNHSQVCYLI